MKFQHVWRTTMRQEAGQRGTELHARHIQQPSYLKQTSNRKMHAAKNKTVWNAPTKPENVAAAEATCTLLQLKPPRDLSSMATNLDTKSSQEELGNMVVAIY